MKKIFFPSTNRTHLARQKLLLDELGKDFNVVIKAYKFPLGEDMNDTAIGLSRKFNDDIVVEKPQIVLVRGDRFEMLPISMVGALYGAKIIHIEGGDLSGVIDNKVRHAITQLADVHFATNKESYARLISMGTDPDWTFNFGSLDAEYASQCPLKTVVEDNFVLVSFHPIPGEDGSAVKEAVHSYFKDTKIIEIKSNKDYGVEYSGNEYSPEDYISLLAYADCLIGNSSSFIKEASVFSTPVVLVGNRQQNRLLPPGVVQCPYEVSDIGFAIKDALRGKRGPSLMYLKPNTSVNIAKTIKRFAERL